MSFPPNLSTSDRSMESQYRVSKTQESTDMVLTNESNVPNVVYDIDRDYYPLDNITGIDGLHDMKHTFAQGDLLYGYALSTQSGMSSLNTRQKPRIVCHQELNAILYVEYENLKKIVQANYSKLTRIIIRMIGDGRTPFNDISTIKAHHILMYLEMRGFIDMWFAGDDIKKEINADVLQDLTESKIMTENFRYASANCVNEIWRFLGGFKMGTYTSAIDTNSSHGDGATFYDSGRFNGKPHHHSILHSQNQLCVQSAGEIRVIDIFPDVSDSGNIVCIYVTKQWGEPAKLRLFERGRVDMDGKASRFYRMATLGWVQSYNKQASKHYKKVQGLVDHIEALDANFPGWGERNSVEPLNLLNSLSSAHVRQVVMVHRTV
jgi:hypothetical protein